MYTVLGVFPLIFLCVAGSRRHQDDGTKAFGVRLIFLHRCSTSTARNGETHTVTRKKVLPVVYTVSGTTEIKRHGIMLLVLHI